MAIDRHPPGPAGNGLLGNTRLLKQDMLRLLRELPQEYGDVVRLRFGPYRALLLSHPSSVRQVLVTEGGKFEKPPRFLRIVRPAFGNGLFANRGAAWKQQRRRMQALLDTVDLDDHCRHVASCVEGTLAAWRHGEENDLARRMTSLTLAIRAKTTLGVEQTPAFSGIHDALHEFMEYYADCFRGPLAWPLWIPTPVNRRMRSAMKRWWTAIAEQINRFDSSDPKQNHLLSGLVQLGRHHDENAMSRRQIRDELATWLMTGTETGANTLAWACYTLANRPDDQARLFDEVQTAWQGRLPQRGDLARLDFLGRFLLETMRLYPQAFLIGRKAVEPFRIGRYECPKRTTVILNQWSIGRDPRWFDNPDDFDPDRWTGDWEARLPGFAYFPYGGGARICMGRSLARLELPLVLAMLVQRFRFALTSDSAVRPRASLTLRPVWDRGAIVIARR